jgi:CDP-6-deoxy-D-xylo-4-hexulose-3-dehydrase
MRCTDLQAFLGISQLKRIDEIVENRQKNFRLYSNLLPSNWGLDVSDHEIVSNFAYPVIMNNPSFIAEKLQEFGIESRPLICGSISRQPFWYERFGSMPLPNADRIHDYGMYLPNNPDMKPEEIEEVCRIINNSNEC